ncbi:ABC transporter permease component (plasmid) [Paucilactobacillus oligofermentans DSM 15707 = LMG 22743]|nr:ABC transporter permease [Paucilactobacillus oligofermentans]CUS27727.1 ABC transporter permease component [Paucilactobacillus oligofermentans DSM 15707 = LMG 22743]
MFLAIREIKKEKLRYGLILTVVVLISYLIFILSALALGLATANTAAVDSWQSKSFVMTKDANGNAGQSLLTTKQVDQLSDDKTATLGITPVNMKIGGKRESAQFVGMNNDEYISKNLQLTKGHLPKAANEVVLADSVDKDIYGMGDKISIGLSDTKYKIVGYAKNATYNTAPVIYGALAQWRVIKGVSDQFQGSVVTSKTSQSVDDKALKTYSYQAFINKLPGYTPQKATFGLMIGFLIVISLIVITIFLYILTVQKLPNLAVLRAQGIPNRFLAQNTLFETFFIMATGIVVGAVLSALTEFGIPDSVPMAFDWGLMGLIAAGLMVTGLLGAIIPIRVISKIDPVSVIGG